VSDGRGRTARDLTVLCALTIALIAPFLDQAFHIDDEVYLRLATALADTPGGFYARLEPLFGRDQALLLHSQHPPLTVGFLAGVVALFGASEPIVHAAYGVFALLAAIGGYLFFRRFCPRPLLAGAILVASPAFVVSAHTIMTDVPFLAFVLLSQVAYLHLLDATGPARGRAALAATLGTLCVFTQYRGLLVIGLLGLYAWRRGRLDRAVLAALAVPVVALGAFELFVATRTGGSALASSAGFLELGGLRIARSTTSYLAGLGAALIALAPALPRVQASSAAPRVACAALIAAVLMWFGRREVSALNAGLGVALMTGGVLVVWDPLRELLRGGASLFRTAPSDDQYLAVAAVALLVSVIAFGLFGCVRNLLVVMPFLIAWILRRATAARFPVRGTAIALGLGAALALACSITDYAWAGLYRRQAAAYAGRADVYFAGEWGFRYYMTAAGARYLTRDVVELPVGAHVIVPEIAAYEGGLPSGLRSRVRPVDERAYATPLPLILMAGAPRNCGWYSEGWGVLPFCLGELVQERIIDYVVVERGRTEP
jgi:hypothetical protein